MADADPDTIEDGKPTALQPWSTTVGFLELVMIHETRSPFRPTWDKDEALTAMRLMRQVIEHRSMHPQTFGAGRIAAARPRKSRS